MKITNLHEKKFSYFLAFAYAKLYLVHRTTKKAPCAFMLRKVLFIYHLPWGRMGGAFYTVAISAS